MKRIKILLIGVLVLILTLFTLLFVLPFGADGEYPWRLEILNGPPTKTIIENGIITHYFGDQQRVGGKITRTGHRTYEMTDTSSNRIQLYDNYWGLWPEYKSVRTYNLRADVKFERHPMPNWIKILYLYVIY